MFSYNYRTFKCIGNKTDTTSKEMISHTDLTKNGTIILKKIVAKGFAIKDHQV